MAHWKGQTQNPDDRPKGKNRMRTWGLIVFLVGLLVGMESCCSKGTFHGSFPEQVRPTSNTARLVKNAAYLKQTGRIELALKELEEVHLREPNNLAVTDALIQCYEELGSFARAQEIYQEALNRTGDHPDLENNRYYSLYLAGRFNEAEAGFRKLLARHPEHQTARNNLGLVLCRQGRETEALSLWVEILREDAARERLGQALAALRREVPPTLTSRPVVAASPADTEPVKQEASSDQGPAASPGKKEPTVYHRQPPADTAADAVTSGYLARRAPHPPAHTASGPIPSPRNPARETVPPGQMAEPEATPAQPAPPPAAAPSSPPVVDSAFRGISSPSRRNWLSAQELISTRIVIKNGNGRKNLARGTRSLLWGEGFNVVAICNHVDFGMEKTVITHRPKAIRVAQELAHKFFPNAALHADGLLPSPVDVRVTLGRNLLQRYDFLAQVAY